MNLPRWLDMDARGRPIDRDGVEPDIQVRAAEKEFTATRDPVLEAALAHLRKAAPSKGKKGSRK